VLREICGTEREEVTGDWRKLCKLKLHDLSCSPGIARILTLRMTWVRHVA
jgi:hypothetical protein